MNGYVYTPPPFFLRIFVRTLMTFERRLTKILLYDISLQIYTTPPQKEKIEVLVTYHVGRNEEKGTLTKSCIYRDVARGGCWGGGVSPNGDCSTSLIYTVLNMQYMPILSFPPQLSIIARFQHLQEIIITCQGYTV